ncbi:putative GATA transcription factor (Ams2) [Aspergillus mulundensis]|uniref:Ams2/SPT21 N-terminal domain-containing protein n=1 Tax=Aspergillus mulundensis TaxID=1810919 RepID=A0A3D8QN25_9EURO|nr:hypothetical protein DSM5745_10171 [Aspergillus mulundensis]RDW63060.1 hypothetical protein DSM5745_10171 [Aspergillus mulundensis]
MRLKVLYTFDNDSKTNCLARWPHLLDIQTAALDEKTHIGVIELKTCIQAIVSASPELVAQLGRDYTVYAYDYSEYETPLVGQGMLSWVLASSSPTPNAPAHQSKTMVTGRVCKNVLGLFSKGAQETLEVKLRLVPVPTALQSEYLDSMQKYRELSNVIPHEFDAQAWTDFLRQNPELMASTSQQIVQASSPVDHAGIERFHQILSAGSTPREIMPMPAHPPYRTTSPTQSALSTASRVQTPASQFQIQQQEQPASRPQPLERSQSDVIRPSSSASMRDADFHAYTRSNARRDSIQSGYGSCDDSSEQQPRKRAKLYRAEAPGKSDLNIERQPSSLRVAASTAASVRIHRPTPINPLFTAAQNSNEEPVRPPTPISDMNHPPRRARPLPSLLRESSTQSNALGTQYNSPYAMSDDHPSVDPTTTSPEESRYQGLFEPSFAMPSSPPILDHAFPARSSPVLPPMTADLDSGFMSAGIDDLLDDELCPPLDSSAKPLSKSQNKPALTVRSAVQASSPVSAIGFPEDRVIEIADDQPENVPATVIEIPDSRPENVPVTSVEVPASSRPTSEIPTEQQQQVKAPPVAIPRAPRASTSRPSSRASMRQTPKPLAPAPISQSELEQLLSAVPESDPVLPSDGATAKTPAPTTGNEDGKPRSGTGARRLKQVKQVQLRLERCIREGQAPPYCENCGAIETPTWRRAHSKIFEGSEEDANQHTKDPLVFFWQPVEKNEQGQVIKFKIYKKKLTDEENDFALVLLCNPCGIWLQKCKSMRPENKWNKASSSYEKRKRTRRTRKDGGPLSTAKGPGGRGASEPSKPDASSPGVSDASTPAADDDATPGADSDANKSGDMAEQKNDDSQQPAAKRRRANSMEPRKSSDKAGSRWQEGDAREALRRAIQSSPAKNLAGGSASAPGERNLPPKPVRRVLFPNSQNEGGPLKALGESVLNSPKRSSRVPVQEANKAPGEKENQTANDLDRLFESPSFEFELCASPTPKRRNQRLTATDKRHSHPSVSPAAKSRRDGALDTTPTRTSARRLQRVQSSPGSVPHLNRTPGRSRSLIPDLPTMSDDIFGTAAFQGMDEMMVDIFSDNAAINTDPLFGLDSRNMPNADWPDWLPSDLSPTKSVGNQNNDDADIINALFSDPDLGKDLFQYPDPRTLDSGFFSSDALQADGMTLEKTDASKDQATSTGQV